MRRLIIIAALSLLLRSAAAQDCNGNGIPDAKDVTSGASEDCDRDGRPDECDAPGASFDLVMEGHAELGSVAAVAAGDLDGDGWSDVAAALGASREIAVLLHQDGAFPLTSYFDVSSQPVSILLADLDGDGDPDAAAGHTRGVAVLWNDGAGALGGETSLALSQNLSSVHAGDLDGDGLLDLLTLNSVPGGGQGNISVLGNEGGGRFGAPKQYAAGDSPLALAPADLDGDGDTDAAVVNSTRGVRMLENAGDGSFPRSTTRTSSLFARQVASGAFDADGNADLLLSTGGTVAVVLNRGGGAFTELQPAGVFAEAWITPLAIPGDFDGDRVLDAAILGTTGVLLNDGNGALAARRISTRLYGAPAAVADLDQDGDMDVLSGGVSFFFNRPSVPIGDCNRNGVSDACEEDCDRNGVPDDCDLASGAAKDCNGNMLPDACEIDCDRDRIPDDCEIAAGSAPDCNGNLVPDPCEPPALDGDGNGVPDDCDIASGAAADCNANGLPDERETEPSYGFRGMAASPVRASVIAPVDFDGDGSTDILARDFEHVLLFRDPGRLGFLSGTVVGSGSKPVAAGDLDGDGDTDICIGSGPYGYGASTELNVLLRTGDRLEKKGSIVLPFSPSSLAAAHFDGDTLPDLCLSGKEGVWLLRGLGNGLFDPPEFVSRTSGALTACDIDGDGSGDLVVHGAAARVLANDGNGRFTEVADLPAGGGGIAAVDLDGDGTPDLATGGGHVHRNDGHGGFSAWTKLGGDARRYGPGSQAVAGADVDGDGGLDILLFDESALEVFRNDGGRAFEAAAALWMPRYGSFYATDFDGDGLADVVLDGLHLLFNLGDAGPPAFGYRSLLHGAEARNTGIAALDLDSDADRELAVTREDGALALHENLGNGSFGAATLLAAGAGAAVMSAADLDGDGDEDIALGFSTGPRVTLLWNDGRLALRAGATLETGGALVSSIAVADLDGQGGLDVAAAAGEGTDISIFLHEGGEAFRAAPQVPFGGPQFILLPLDADGDGDIDLAAFHGGFRSGDTLSFLLNDGRAGFERGGALPLGGGAREALAADLNGDDRLDLAVSISEGKNCWTSWCEDGITTVLFLSAGNGKFREVRRGPGGSVTSGLAASDFDLDGSVDLVLPSIYIVQFDSIVGGTGDRVALNDGDGSFSREVLLPAGSGGPVSAGDLDGDGVPDLASLSWRGISIVYSRTGAASPDRDLDGVPDECDGARFRRGDADADGAVAVADAIVLLGRLFLGEAAGTCRKAEDWNDDGAVDLSDALGILRHLFLGGPGPRPPHARCGLDSSEDALGCDDHAPCA